MRRTNLTHVGGHFSNELKATEFGVSQLREQFKYGDIVWIKINDNSWWPGQVVNEESVSYKPQKQAKEEVLVRMYGTYDYFYVDLVKCSSEFENTLKQENISSTEAFQKALEEDLSHVKSAGKSKRKVSESGENATANGPKAKKQNGTEKGRNGALKVNDTMRVALKKQKLTNVKELKSKKVRDEAFKEKTVKHVTEGKLNGLEKVRNGASKIKDLKNDAVNKTKRKDVKEQMTEKGGGEPSEDKTMKQATKEKLNVTKKARNSASKIKSVKEDALKKPKHKDVKEQMLDKVQAEPSKDKTVKEVIHRKLNRREKARKGASKIKVLKQDALGKPARKDVEEQMTEKGRDDEDKPVQHGGLAKAVVRQKARKGVSKVKLIKQNGFVEPDNGHVMKVSVMKSPSSTKSSAPEETTDLSARQRRVMQTLGLIAPLGSPFC